MHEAAYQRVNRQPIKRYQKIVCAEHIHQAAFSSNNQRQSHTIAGHFLIASQTPQDIYNMYIHIALQSNLCYCIDTCPQVYVWA